MLFMLLVGGIVTDIHNLDNIVRNFKLELELFCYLYTVNLFDNIIIKNTIMILYIYIYSSYNLL